MTWLHHLEQEFFCCFMIKIRVLKCRSAGTEISTEYCIPQRDEQVSLLLKNPFKHCSNCIFWFWNHWADPAWLGEESSDAGTCWGRDRNFKKWVDSPGKAAQFTLLSPRNSFHFYHHLKELVTLSFRKKACKYFEQGKGTCPFGGKCLYLHAYPDGTRAEPEKPRKQLSSEGTVRVSRYLAIHLLESPTWI